MSNYGTYAICPYFNTEVPTIIKCEGIVKLDNANTYNQVMFENKEKKEEYRKKYCESYNWKNCPYAVTMEKQWDNKEKLISLVRR